VTHSQFGISGKSRFCTLPRILRRCACKSHWLRGEYLNQRGAGGTEILQIRDYLKLLSELASVVRPGGVLLFADGEMQLYDEHQQPLPVSEPGDELFSWTQLVFHAAYNSMKMRGSQVVSCPQNTHNCRLNSMIGHAVIITIVVIADGGARKCGITENLHTSWTVAERLDYHRLLTKRIYHTFISACRRSTGRGCL
jgi:hypothetical protein